MDKRWRINHYAPTQGPRGSQGQEQTVVDTLYSAPGNVRVLKSVRWLQGDCSKISMAISQGHSFSRLPDPDPRSTLASACGLGTPPLPGNRGSRELSGLCSFCQGTFNASLRSVPGRTFSSLLLACPSSLP